MTMPRPVVPGRFYMITRRCTQRQFLLRPDDETNNAFTYCLAEAAQRFDVDVLMTCAMSNHHHTVIYDRLGTRVEFTEHFHKMFAKCQNVHRGRWENLWATEQVSVVELLDTMDVLAKIVYAATNPVKDRLVEKVRHWPGVNGLHALLEQRSLRTHRPRYFFREDGVMPAAIELRIALPAELGDSSRLLEIIREQVAEVERRVAAERLRTGAPVLGRRGVLRQSWRASPRTLEPRRGLRPTFAARSVWSRIEAIQRNREFIAQYAEARERMNQGDPIPFPFGTYWLRRFVNVPIAAPSN